MKIYERTIKINGVSVRYFTNLRSLNTGSNNIVLLLHGFMSDGTSMMGVAETFDEGTQFIVPDLPGFGGSEAISQQAHLSDYVGWLDGFITELNIEPTVYVGYSFGAYLAILYLAKYKVTKAARLILITPVVRISWQVRVYGRGFRFMAVKIRKLAERLYYLQYDMTTRYLRRSKHPTTRLLLHEKRREELEFLNPDLVLKLFGEFLEIDLMRYAKKITHPTLVLIASKDNVAKNNATRQFARTVRGPVSVVEIRHAGHLLPMEEPSVTAVSMRSHLY